MTTRTVNSTVYFGPNNKGYNTVAISQQGANTPKELRNAGIYNENWYLASYRRESATEVLCKQSNGTYPFALLQVGGAMDNSLSPGLPTDLDILPRLVEKWRQSEFNLGVTAGESAESWHMIARRTAPLINAARRLRKGDLRAAMRAIGIKRGPSRRQRRRLDSGDISGTWLEMQYGWLPLVSDIYAASEAAEFRIIPPTLRVSKTFWGREPAPVFFTKGECSYVAAPDWVNENALYLKVYLTSTDVSIPERLGLTDPLTILWELTPFSFVVDWIAPIGDLLTSIHAARVIPVGKVVRTKVQRRHYSFEIEAGARYNGRTTQNPGSVFYDSIRVDREIHNNLPSALSLAETFPRSVKANLDWPLKRVANAVALMHQLFKGRRVRV